MEPSVKQDMIEGKISSQTSLADKFKENPNRKLVKHIIPGGAALFTDSEPVDRDRLVNILSQALRRVSKFEDVTISFLKDIPENSGEKVKLYEFPKNATKTYWETNGRAELAKLIANVFSRQENKPLVMYIDKNAIYSTVKPSKAKTNQPGGDNWEPHLLFTKKLQDQYVFF